MEIKLKLSTTEHKDLLSYCNLNDLLISTVVKDSFITGFNIERYGLLNPSGTYEKEVVKEVIIEKRVEIPVEVIKEVVKIEYVEVPVEVVKEVIKTEYVEKPVIEEKEIIQYIEVPIEKIVEVEKEVIVIKTEYVSDDTKINLLLKKIQELENKPVEKIEVIKEIIKEIEVPVEVVKEIIIEKESDGNWKPKLDALQNTVHKLKQDNIEKEKKIREYEQTIQDIQKFQEDKKAVYLSGSNLNKTL
jgi:hypothetical protein